MTKPYMLPDGTRITLGRERYRSAELLFDPATALRQEHSLQTAILDCESGLGVRRGSAARYCVKNGSIHCVIPLDDHDAHRDRNV